MNELRIESLRDRPVAEFCAALAPLVAESAAEGFRHVRRLSEDYGSGANRFDRPGEALFGAFDGERLIAVGGLNVGDTFEGLRTGRVRRVYVAPAYRRRGVGRRLMAEIIAAARPHFDSLVLRTHNPDAALFYENLGFAVAGGGEAVTHRLDLSPNAVTHSATLV